MAFSISVSGEKLCLKSSGSASASANCTGSTASSSGAGVTVSPSVTMGGTMGVSST